MNAESKLGRAALAYVEKFNFAVFPCRPRGKEPLTEHGVKDATKDLAQIRAWWDRWPDANVGIATGAISSIVVTDIDPRHCGDNTLEALEAHYGKLPETPTVLTGGGGLHIYFRHPGGVVPNSAGKIGPGIDVRGDGGYVIAPKSLHESGNHYLWEVSSRIDDVPLAQLPVWLREGMTGPEAGSSSNKGFEPPPIFEDGTRNNYLYRMARSAHARFKLNADELLNLLRGVNQSRCKPPVEESELAQIAQNAATQADRPDFVQPNPEAVRLAALQPLDYEKIRRQEAKRLGMRVTVLDAEVEKLRPHAPSDESEPLAPPAPEPWPEPVEACALLNELREFVQRFVLIDAYALIAIVLWIVFTYVFEVAETSPRLTITSPIKRCGKTRLLEILLLLCPRTVPASNLSTNSVFRVIDAAHPTLLIDEVDTLRAHDKDELRGILNSGHTRAYAYVIRNVPVGARKWKPTRFSTWAPIAMGGIGKVPDTWADRSIMISMQRKPPREKVERLTRRNIEARDQASALASKLARLAQDSLDALRTATPAIPESLNDRQTDNWELLLAIADFAGTDWSQRARDAALALSGEEGGESDSSGERLLRDVCDTFTARQTDRLPSKELCEALHCIEGAPWAEFGRARKPITQNGLARLLVPFLIVPHTIRLTDGQTPKGYMLSDFADAFRRYVAIPPVSKRHNATTAGAQRESGDFKSAMKRACGVSKNGLSPYGEKTCGVVADENPGISADHDLSAEAEAEINRLEKAGEEPREGSPDDIIEQAIEE